MIPLDLPIVLLRYSPTRPHVDDDFPVGLPSQGGGFYTWLGSDVGGSDRLLDSALKQLRTVTNTYPSDYYFGIMVGGMLMILGQCFTGTKPPTRTCIGCGKERDERQFPQYTYRRQEDGGYSAKQKCSTCLNAKSRQRRQQAKESQGALLEH
jgi:hypothetical protein